MAFQPLSFPNYNDFISNWQKQLAGYPNVLKDFYEPGQFRRKEEEEELANAFQKMKMQQYPEEQRIVNALKEAQAKKYLSEVEQQNELNKSPFGFLQNLPTGDIGQWVGLQKAKLYAQQHPEDTQAKELAENLEKSFILKNEKNEALKNRYQALADTTDYRLMTPSGRTQTEAWLRGMGYNDIQNGINDLRKYGSLEKLAASKNIDINSLQPNYAPTAANVTATKNRSALIAEIDAISPLIAKPMAKVQPKIWKYSPSQIVGALGDMSVDEQAQILAARALQPEIASLRFRALQGTVGIEAVRELTDASLGNLKIFEPLVTPEVYEKMQQYMTSWIKTGTQAYEKSMYGGKDEKHIPTWNVEKGDFE